MKSTFTLNPTPGESARRLRDVQYRIAEILGEATSWNEVAPQVLKALCEGIGWDWGAIWQLDLAIQTLKPLTTWHREKGAAIVAFEEATRNLKFARGEGFAGRVWAERKPLWFENLQQAGLTRAEEAARAEFRSGFAFPIIANGNVIGVLEAFAQQTQLQDPEVMETVRVVGIQIGLYVSRQQNLRDVSRLAAIIQDSEDAILSKDLNGIILDWNPAAERLYGYSRQEIVGQSVAILFPPELKAQVPANLEHIANGESIRLHDTVRVRKNGTRVAVSATISPVRDEAGRVIGASTIARDISDRQVLERAQEFLARATHDLSASLNVETILATVAERAVPFLADWCAVHILTEDGMVRRLAFTHHDPQVVARITAREQEYALNENAKHLVSHVLRTGASEFFNEVPLSFLQEAARDDAHLKTLQQLGLRAYVCIPLQARGRILGTITLAMSDSGRTFSPNDVELAQELVRHASLAADNAWLYQESQAAQARLKLVAEASIEVVSALDYETRMERLAQLVVPRFADWCVINLVERDGSIRLAALSHANPEMEATIREWAEQSPLAWDAPGGTPKVIRTGKAEWNAKLPPPDDESEHDVSRKGLRTHSYMIVPLIARGRTFGAISFVLADSARQYTIQDLLTGEEIARRAALALDNAAHYQQEQMARHEAEETAARLSALQRATAALATALTSAQVGHVILETGLPALGAQGGVFAEISADGESLKVVNWVGYSDERVLPWREYPLSSLTPLSEAARGELITLESPEIAQARYPLLHFGDQIYKAWMVLPLRLQGRDLGGLLFSFQQERIFTELERGFATALAQQCAQALERARLYESELAARQTAEHAAQKSDWLTEASHVLASSLDYKTTLAELAQLVVSEFADWCTIDMAKGDGTAEQLLMAHQDPAKLEWAKEYGEEVKQFFTPNWDAPLGLPNVLRTGKPEIYYEIPDSLLKQVAENDVQFEILKSIGYSSVMIVPLKVQDKTLGAITMVNTDSRRHFTDDDLEFAELFAGRAAVAIENARLYQETQRLNEELERRVEQRTYELSEAYKDLSREVVERTRAEEMTRALLSISNKLNSTLDVQESLDILIQESIGALNGSSGFAGLRTAQGMRASKYFANGTAIPVEHVWEYGKGLPGWVWEHSAPYVTNDAPNDPVMLYDLRMNEGVRTAICTPIFDSQDQVIGFLNVRDKADAEPFTGADVEFLMALSPIASIALENARAYQKISQAEGAVQNSYAQLRALAARLQTIREEERTHIARELHDELGQALTALKMDLAVLMSGLPPRNKQSRERAQSLSDQIDATIKTVRRMSSQLRPGMLDDLGLGPSMEWYAQDFQARTGILVETNIVEQEIALNHAQATALYRIFQETLTNVARHANAARVQAKLELHDNDLVMEITDDGQGFDMEQVRGKRSLGLLGMRERAEMIQGTLEIQSAVGKGTTTVIHVPLGSAEADGEQDKNSTLL